MKRKDGGFLNDEETLAALYAPKPAEGMKDTIMLNVTVHLSFKERVLLLFRPLCIKARIDTENVVGKTHGVTHAWAARWRWPWQSNGAEVSIPRNDEESK